MGDLVRLVFFKQVRIRPWSYRTLLDWGHMKFAACSYPQAHIATIMALILLAGILWKQESAYTDADFRIWKFQVSRNFKFARKLQNDTSW